MLWKLGRYAEAQSWLRQVSRAGKNVRRIAV